MKTPFTVNRRQALWALGAAGACAGMPALAQAGFPSRPLRFVLGLPAGGAADISVRLLGEEMQKDLKQPVIVDNRPGGLYQMAVQTTLAAPADGHTLMYVNSSFAAVQAVHKRFDLTRDFLPLLKVSDTPGVLVVRPDSPFKTIQDLIAYGRAHPKQLTYAMLGVGSYEHLTGLAFEQAAGFEGLAVPYKGAPDMVNAVIAGDIHFAMVNVVTAMQFIAQRQLRALAARDAQRLKALPNVPTMAEAGIHSPLSKLWSGYVVRVNTPVPLVQRLQQEIMKAMSSPAVAQKMTDFGVQVSFSKSSDDFSQLIQSDVATMGELGKRLDIGKG